MRSKRPPLPPPIPDPDPRLDPHETTEHSTHPRHRIVTHTSMLDSRAFRHSGSMPMRNAVIRAFDRLGIQEGRHFSYVECGSTAVIEQSREDPNRYRVRCYKCFDRWCPACQNERRRSLLARVLPRIPKGEMRMITLTMRHASLPLKLQLAQLIGGFKRLRRSTAWKRTQRGGYQFLEISFNERTQQWHPHLHILAEGSYIPKAHLSRAWHKASRGSYIIDINLIRDAHKVGRYVTKYVTKPVPAKVYRHPYALDEAIVALKGVRLYAPFGSWYAISRRDDPETKEVWDPICTFDELWRQVRGGRLNAIVIFTSLKAKIYREQTDASERSDELETGVLRRE